MDKIDKDIKAKQYYDSEEEKDAESKSGRKRVHANRKFGRELSPETYKKEK